jgi:peptidyl-prolyl cis-trans isomerase D
LYSSIKDSDVSVSDAEIVDYMKKNEKRFKTDETREVEYVLIEDKASKEDEAEVKESINC